MQIKSVILFAIYIQEHDSGMRQHGLIFTGTARTFSPSHQSEKYFFKLVK